jgi:hypothetical protein
VSCKLKSTSEELGGMGVDGGYPELGFAKMGNYLRKISCMTKIILKHRNGLRVRNKSEIEDLHHPSVASQTHPLNSVKLA